MRLPLIPLLLVSTSIACDKAKPIEANQEPVFVDFSVFGSIFVVKFRQSSVQF